VSGARATRRRRARALTLALLLLAPIARAQVVPERALDVVRATYNAGNHAETLKRARDALAAANFTEVQRLELLKLAGLSAFNLGDSAQAEQLFFQLLQLDPDFVLDPFAVPPSAIRLFEEVRKKNVDGLNLVRQQLVLRADQQKRDALEREQRRAEEEAARRRLEQLSRQVTVRTIEPRPYFVNFLPFGAGQFQQKRLGAGIALATTQGALGITSIISWLAINGLFQDYTYTYTDRIYPFSVTVRRIPPERANLASTWNVVKLVSGIGFYALWVVGVVDALVRHQDAVITTTTEAAPPPAAAQPGVSLDVFSTSGGLGAGLNIRF
jgi:tetratricopeptide (TPR) repeat protein